MRIYVFLFTLLTAVVSLAETSLRVGDILLQPLHCRLCYLIEEEENSRFSHMGVVLQTSPNILVGEAWGSVRSVSFEEFAQKTKKRETLKVLRFRNPNLRNDIALNATELLPLFQREFEGKKYDEAFLWNNFDGEGRQMLYCSEFVSKLYQAFMRLEMPIKRMHFFKNRDEWNKYFKGNIPDGQWGNSPADFERSELFYSAGTIVVHE